MRPPGAPGEGRPRDCISAIPPDGTANLYCTCSSPATMSRPNNKRYDVLILWVQSPRYHDKATIRQGSSFRPSTAIYRLAVELVWCMQSYKAGMTLLLYIAAIYTGLGARIVVSLPHTRDVFVVKHPQALHALSTCANAACCRGSSMQKLSAMIEDMAW